MIQEKETEVVEGGKFWHVLLWERIANYRYSKYLSRLPTKFRDPHL